MANVLNPKLLRRGFLAFVAISLLGFVGILIRSGNLPTFLYSLTQIHWIWLLVGLGLASMDWIGGGLRNWVVVRHVHKNPPLGGMILAGGMAAWAGYLTPLNSGAGPMMIYGMRRAGVPVPVAVTSTLITFVATVAFFAIAGPLAILLGAGRSLGRHGNVLGLSLYDLFLGSLGAFVGLGILFIIIIVFPGLIHRFLHFVALKIGKRSRRVATRLEGLQRGIDSAHRSFLAFNTPKGWLVLLQATILSGPSHANKLLAGYVALRAVGVHANFVDVLLLQTFITFLLYFAPTPGASGIAEVLSAAVMSSVYLPPQVTTIYTLIWRSILSYFTLGFGFFVFSYWISHRLKGIDDQPEPVPE
ncbi:MAG TPA: lysylphosphatidylglycerol synthase transmembrane domain-containing protein [Gemmatimonadales bacterium]|nr:lysylphosphatidylglycerol synthase transmembrane domain-containing protein [Gemmatimonadales bacterium]